MSPAIRPAPRTTAAIRGSIAWHAAMGVAAVALPTQWPWWLAGIAANHALLTTAGLLPRSRLLGPNLTRLPDTEANARRIVLTFDDGPDPQVTPRVLAILREAGARASFFCIGERVASYPELARRIVDAGHTVENHTQRHRHDFSLLGTRGFRREIGAAQTTIEAAVGSRPLFFRAPAGLRNPMLQPVLAELDLRLAAWSRRAYDTVRGDPQRLHARLTAGLQGREILLLHDGNAARSAAREPAVLEALPHLLSTLESQRLEPVTLREALS